MTEPASFLGGKVTLHAGDCLAVLAGMEPDSIDACLTDPPYHFASILKRYGKTDINGEGTNEARARAASDQFIRASRGFMGKEWDGGDVAFKPSTWGAVLRVLKPGAHMVAFGAPKNVHRLTCAIEDAGFEIRDVIMWLFGTGFPKSHNLTEEWHGWGTALKPAYEPIILARKPLVGTVAANALAHGTGAINIDGCRVELGGEKPPGGSGKNDAWRATEGRVDKFRSVNLTTPATGRWPANIIHDGSEEVLAAFPDAPGALRPNRDDQRSQGSVYGAISRNGTKQYLPRGDSGSAARFFYSAKAGKADRAGSKHPTVKPIALIRYLCRLITPPGGTILDPFAGTGTTGQAAIEEVFSAILIEREAEYQADIARRMGLVADCAEEVPQQGSLFNFVSSVTAHEGESA